MFKGGAFAHASVSSPSTVSLHLNFLVRLPRAGPLGFVENRQSEHEGHQRAHCLCIDRHPMDRHSKDRHPIDSTL